MKELKRFKHITELSVRWGDMDAFQHVNNTVYLKWVEHGRVTYMEKLMMGALKSGNRGPILARQDIRYLFPVTFPDTVTIAFRTVDILEDRIQCECRIYSNEHKKLAAIVYNTIMAYDFKKLKKAQIPKSWITAINEIDFS